MEILKSTFEEILQLIEDEQVRTEFPLIGKRCNTYKSVDEGSYYIAIENETLVGAALCSIRTDGMFRINLFEVRESWHNMGIGSKMFEFISEDVGNKPITLSYAGNKNGEAYNFWVKMGFVQRYRDGRSHEMINKEYASLSRRYASTKIGHAKIRTVIKETERKVEIIKINLETNEQIS